MCVGSRCFSGEEPSSPLMYGEGGEAGSLAVIARGQSWLMAPELLQLMDPAQDSGTGLALGTGGSQSSRSCWAVGTNGTPSL